MRNIIIFILLVSIAALTKINACTGLMLTTKDGSIVHGRTVEFVVNVETSIVVIPRNYQFIGTTPKGKGLAYTSKYAVVGGISFDELAVNDGLNEKGLAIGSFYFPGYAEYAPITTDNQSKALSPTEFPNWILTQFATIDEVKAALDNVVIAPTVIKNWGPTPPPFHYIVYDKNGNSIVIEPMKGKLVVHDSKLGVITNSPDFNWQMTNLCNYLNLDPANVSSKNLGGLTLRPFGQGSGMFGLPGDFTPPSRFIRAALFAANAVPVESGDKAILQIFHILNNFDIPMGISYAVQDGQKLYDYTMTTCVRDPINLKYYYKTYDDQTVYVFDLKKFNLNAPKVVKLRASGSQKFIDRSADLR